MRRGELRIDVSDVCKLPLAHTPDREALLRRLRAFRGRLPEDFTFDRDEANARSGARPGQPS
jgi:antitoxin MazE